MIVFNREDFSIDLCPLHLEGLVLIIIYVIISRFKLSFIHLSVYKFIRKQLLYFIWDYLTSIMKVFILYLTPHWLRLAQMIKFIIFCLFIIIQALILWSRWAIIYFLMSYLHYYYCSLILVLNYLNTLLLFQDSCHFKKEKWLTFNGFLTEIHIFLQSLTVYSKVKQSPQYCNLMLANY